MPNFQILSPVRLPFRHTGAPMVALTFSKGAGRRKQALGKMGLPVFPFSGFFPHGARLVAMAKIKLTCPNCGQSFDGSTQRRDTQISCPGCKKSVPIPRAIRKKRLFYLLVPAALFALAILWLLWPTGFHWKDRRPIGVLFLASNYHSSTTNPRGWFNNPALDVTGPGGQERFKQALFNYASNSIAILKRVGAQGVIVWDLEGEKYPHKTTFIGDPRLLPTLAPEMAPVADEFFKRFRDAGFSVGVTIRPQQLVFENGIPRQTTVLDIKRLLLAKIDYARTNWGATMFYIDSNDGLWRPDEAWQLRLLARQRPDVLLIPEHHYLPYWAFSAPYVSVRKGNPDTTTGLARKLYPNSFRVLNIGDASNDDVTVAWHEGDVVLFRAWYWNDDCRLVQNLQHKQP